VNRKLSERQVRWVRERLAEKELTHQEIADALGVTKHCIHSIAYHNWKGVK